MFKVKILTPAGAVLLAALLLGALPALGYNPSPGKGDLVLPLPRNQSLAFRPVYMGEGGDPFALRKFKVGDPTGGFKEHPTTVALGGSFLGQSPSGGSDWLFYLAKYEITEAQYYAVMDQNAPAGAARSNLPVRNISWFQAQQFLDRLNQWLFQNALNKLPRHNQAVGYLRLPTEIEWEFAARGGSAVEPDQFDQRLPYSDSLAKHEWFSGPESSHNKIQKAGVLAPNPLGLHDLLGNVSEMTSSLYRIEYYQGRPGGFVARGGHYLTSRKSVRSALRTEEPFYLGNAKRGLKPNSKPTMGFRPVISAIIYVDRQTSDQLASAWEDYRQGKGADLPASVSGRSVSTQTGAQGKEAAVHLERLEKHLASVGLSDRAKQELGLLKASLSDIGFTLKQAELDSAYAWAKIAAERGFFLFRELRKLPLLKKAQAIAEKSNRTAMVARYRDRLAELEQNLQGALATYSDSFRQLSKAGVEAVEAGFKRYEKFLSERKAEEQLRVLPTVRKHYAAFAKSQRADPRGWEGDFAAL